MDQPQTRSRKRKGTQPSVIEATAGTPMPVVEAAPAAEVPASPPAAPAAAPVSTAAVETATPPAAVSAEPQAEEKTMTIDTTTATAQAETMFAEAQTRAKGAMEKGAKLVEELTQFNKGNLEAMVESSKIAARGFETLGQDAAAYAKQSFEQSTAALKSLSTVKSPTEFMKLQNDLIRQSFDQMVAQTSRSTESMLKLAGEVVQPISNRVAVAAEKVRIAA